MGAGLKRARAAALATQRKSVTWSAFGILNGVGQPWTPRTFDTEDAAQDYITDYSYAFPGEIDLTKHRVVPVRVTVRATE